MYELNWSFFSIQYNQAKYRRTLYKRNDGLLGILLFQCILKSSSFASSVYKELARDLTKSLLIHGFLGKPFTSLLATVKKLESIVA